jgi:hypothetical protein
MHINFSLEDGQDWPKHLGANFSHVLLYFILVVYCVDFIVINDTEGALSKVGRNLINSIQL